MEVINTDLTAEETERARESVLRGAAVLDKVEPGWELKIDLAELNLSSGCQCVLGQVYGEYDEGCEVLFEMNPPYSDDVTAVMAHGFVVSSRGSRLNGEGYEFVAQWMNNYYEVLDELWIEQVKERFDRGVVL